MTTIWPWIVIGVGVVTLFVYRWWTTARRNVGFWGAHTHDSMPDEGGHHARGIFGSNYKSNHYDASGAKFGESGPRKEARFSQSTRQLMPVIISFVVLLSALYIILSTNTYADGQQKWAFGAAGSIMGYWLKT